MLLTTGMHIPQNANFLFFNVFYILGCIQSWHQLCYYLLTYSNILIHIVYG